MPTPLTRTLHAYAADARAAFSAAPVEVGLGFLLSAALSMQVRERMLDEDEFFRVAAAVALAFPLVFALSVLRARGVISAAARWAGTAAVLVGCAGFGAAALRTDHTAGWWRWALLACAAVLLLVMTPALPRRQRERRREWAFAWRLAVRIVGIGLYSVALFGLLAGAVAAIVSLFDLRQPDHLYADLAGWVFFAFAPWIFVGGIHRLSAPPPAGVPEPVSRLGRWLYAPVLVIYLLILYAYAARVAATGELPRNLVSPLVIAAGLIGLLGAVLLEPVHDDEEHRGLSMLVRGIPVLLLPLVPLAWRALMARLDEYGWTEFRYARLAVVASIGILAVLGTIRLVRRRPPMLAIIPAVFAALLLLSAVGPWSAPAVSRRDQTARLRAAFHEARLDPRALPADSVQVDSAVYAAINSGARYLMETHGRGALRAVVPALPDSVRATWRIADQLGIRGGCHAQRRVHGEVAWDTGVPGVMAGRLHQVMLRGADSAVVGTGPGRVRLRIAGDQVRVDAEGWSASAGLSPIRRMLEAVTGECDPRWAGGAPKIPAAAALVPLRDASGALRAQLVLTNVGVEAADTPVNPLTYRITDLNAILLIPG